MKKLYFLVYIAILLCSACSLKPSINNLWHEADIQIEVVLNGKDTAMLTVYRNEFSTRTIILQEQAVIGRNSMTDKKQEGDNKTPVGVYAIERAFGLSKNPGTLLPYVQLSENDVWVDDIHSRYYNKWAKKNFADKDWNSAEDLSSEKVAYQYAMIIEYNTHPVEYKKGSAIFLHCKKADNTSGCLAVSEDTMKKILKISNSKIVIAIARNNQELQAITGIR